MLNLKHIPAVMAVLQEGSVTAASKKLFISQPALSQVIKSVEEELGAPIFEREGNRMLLTRAGELYVEAGQRIQNIDHTLHARVADGKSDVYGDFRLGISAQRGLQLLPSVIPAFIEKYPHVKIRLCEEGSDRLEQLISEGQCDIAFITTSSKRNRLRYVLIENEKLVLLASKSTALAHKYPDGTTLNMAEAREECFVSMAPGHSVRAIQDKLFEEYGMRPRILLETHNMEAAKSIAARSGAVFLLPNVYAPDSMVDRYRVHIYPLVDSNFERHFYFCYRQGMYLTRYQHDLVQLVCDKLRVPCALSEEET